MRKLSIILMAITVSVVMLLTSIAPVMAGAPPDAAAFGARVTLPFDETGVHAGAEYRISVPENWNGTLLVYAHGLYAGLVGGLPRLTIPDPMVAPGSQGGTSIEADLLQMGYALAGSSYSSNGWAVKEGMQDTLALITYFNGRVGKPNRVILWGFSMGGVIALASAERYGGIIDGVVAEASNGAGAPMTFDAFLSPRIMYDVLFGWNPDWGSPSDLRDNIDFWSDVFPVAFSQFYHPVLNPNPALKGKTEFWRLAQGVPESVFYSVPPAWVLGLWFFIEVGANLEQRAGGNPLQNLNARPLAMNAGNIAYLNGLGVDAVSLINEINSRRTVEASVSARNYLEHYATFSGKVKCPVIQLHSVFDPMAIVAHCGVYKNTLVNAGKGDFLLQAFTGAGTGHGIFTKTQYLQALAAMEEWLDTGTRPDPAGYFKTIDGFLPGFVPGPWPYTQ